MICECKRSFFLVRDSEADMFEKVTNDMKTLLVSQYWETQIWRPNVRNFDSLVQEMEYKRELMMERPKWWDILLKILDKMVSKIE